MLSEGAHADNFGEAAARETKALAQLLKGINEPDLLPKPMITLVRSVKTLLMEEVAQLNSIMAKARDNNIEEEITENKPFVGAPPPDTSALDALEKKKRKLTGEFKRAEVEFNIADEEVDEEDDDPDTLRELKERRAQRDTCRRKLRECAKSIDVEMSRLAKHGSVHYPEVLVSVPSVASFKRCEFLRTDGLGMKSYENLQRMEAGGHSAIFSGTLDGRAVVLKEYDLTSGTINAVIQEVQKLHEMRHPNIVEVEAVFEERKKGSTKMYLQMPRYSCDFKCWLRKNINPPVQHRRKILLGLLRAVDRVHQFKLTHNDISACQQ